MDLILGTIGREEEIKWLVETLAAQTRTDFRLLIVDQSGSRELEGVAERYRPAFPILYLRSKPGLARARNIGLLHAQSNIVGFPDDDCLYPKDLVERVLDFFASQPGFHGLMGRCVDGYGKPSVARWDTEAGEVSRANVWRRAVSTTVFLRGEVPKAVGWFDESLGVGSGTSWGSGDETDYLIRALDLGFRFYYDPTLFIVHGDPLDNDPSAMVSRGYRYGMGTSRVLTKHGYPWWFIVYFCLRPLVGCGIALLNANMARTCFHWAVFKGRLTGLKLSAAPIPLRTSKDEAG
jgi:GT2 family glycosyltransferase